MNQNDWNKRYESRQRVWTAKPDPAVVALADEHAPGTVLDLACGEGRNALYLAERGWTVTAVDFSSVALARLQEYAQARKVHVDTVEAGWEDYLTKPLPHDLVLIAYLHPPPAQRDDLFARLKQWMKPDATLLLVLHHRAGHGKWGPPEAERLVIESDIEPAFPGISVEVRQDATDTGETAPTVVARWTRPV